MGLLDLCHKIFLKECFMEILKKTGDKFIYNIFVNDIAFL